MQARILPAIAALALAGAGTVATAQSQHAPGHGAPPQRGMMQGHAMPGQAPADPSPATRAYVAVTEKMHRDMTIAYSGNADRDFAAGMIPHHQSAIDMARVVLEHGTDPQVRVLAEGIIREQEREIAQLRGFLQRLPAR